VTLTVSVEPTVWPSRLIHARSGSDRIASLVVPLRSAAARTARRVTSETASFSASSSPQALQK
jgi:hypothetical protein